MHREKFPEKIPFRLTRMLTNAMEVSGIEGNFRCTCEKVMTVLRDNRDSLIAMLEAFVHDPLISWRLLGVHGTEGTSGAGGGGAPSGPSDVTGSAVQGGGGEVADGDEEEDGRGDGCERLLLQPKVEGKKGTVRVDSPAITGGTTIEEPHRVRFAEGGGGGATMLSTVSESDIANGDYGGGGGDGEGDDEEDEEEGGPSAAAMQAAGEDVLAAAGGGQDSGERERGLYPHKEVDEEPLGTSVSRRARMMDLHLEIGSLAASLSANKTRFSSSMAMPSHSLAHSRLDHRSARERELMQAVGPEGLEAPAEVLNEKAIAVIRRVQDKLTGLDFDNEEALDVAEQVERLIQQATSNENLCQCFIGFCAFW